MTIGWGEVGRVWSRPVFTVLVRRSRYTYGCLLASESFTVNVPAPGKLQEELLFCGTKSGRDLDKVASCGLTLVEGKKVATPVLAECTLHYECKVILRKQLAREDLSDPGILAQYYPNDDHHMIVIGEILAVYPDR
jgi:flavin reductase (DIM6/NTAB) family NADH-FMN oxidoreductase RutF